MKRLKEIQIVSIQLVSLARRENAVYTKPGVCAMRSGVSIQLVSLARREF